MESRVTQDIITGVILEDRHSNRNPARAHVAGQRLDRVRDIETVVTLRDAAPVDEDAEVIDLTVDSDVEAFEMLKRGEKWADCDSD